MINREYKPNPSNRDVLTKESVPSTGMKEALEAAQFEILKQGKFIEYVKDEIEWVMSEFIEEVICAPKANFKGSSVKIETCLEGLLVSFTALVVRNPAVNKETGAEVFTFTVPDNASAYILKAFQANETLGTTKPVGREGLRAIVKPRVEARLISKFVIPNINRILASE